MRRCALAIVVTILLPACAGGGATTASDAVAPFGLASVTWPVDVEALDAVFAALPAELLGRSRLDGGYQTAIYGAGKERVATIYAVDLGSAACPGMSGGSLVRSTLEQRGGKLRIDQQSPDAVAADTPAYLVGTRGRERVLGWSVPKAQWVIAIEAANAGARAAAAAAVVAAARTALAPSA